MPALDMRTSVLTARQDLAWSMKDRGFPPEYIRTAIGYTDLSSVYRAIAAGKERADSNEFRTSPRRFGIEIEFNNCTRTSVKTAIKARDRHFPIEVQDYNHTVQPVWKLITDSSVNCTGVDEHGADYYGDGLEMVSPILQGKEGYAQLETVVAAIHDVGGDVDNSCGLHVHHDAGDLTPNQVAGLLRFYIENQLVIDRFLAPVRRSTRNNQWCHPWQEREKATLYEAAKTGSRSEMRHFDRYRTVNVTAYPKYGSLEFRQHQGTLSYAKMLRWVKLGQSIVEGAMTFTDPDSVPSFTEPAPFLEWLVRHGGLARSVAKELQKASDEYDLKFDPATGRKLARV